MPFKSEAVQHSTFLVCVSVCMSTCKRNTPAPFMADLSFWMSSSALKGEASVIVPR